MIINLPLILLCLTLFTGVVYLMSSLMAGKNKLTNKNLPVVLDYSRSLFPIFLIVFLIRSFLFQPYQVPTGSLEPTVIPGDFILVNQYEYGLHLPVWNNKFVQFSHPKRGDVALFRWPVDPRVTFVKRVIGVPGDVVSYQNKQFTINGKLVPLKELGSETIEQFGLSYKMMKLKEMLPGQTHDIYVCAKDTERCPSSEESLSFKDLKVPAGYYLMIGDNRDDSDDSRDWGFVKEDAFIGKAMFVWMSWDSSADLLHKIRWNRLGTLL